MKGFTRFKGALTGTLSLVFSMRWGTEAVSALATGLPLGWWAVCLFLAGGTLLFVQAQKLTYYCHAWILGLGHGPLL